MKDTFEGKQCNIIEVAYGVTDRNSFIQLDDLTERLKDKGKIEVIPTQIQSLAEIYEYYDEKFREQLLEKLYELTNSTPHITDILRDYRMWFDKHGIESEGEDGWPLPLVFEEENIQAFVKDWKEEEYGINN